jgi:hypothetical protein
MKHRLLPLSLVMAAGLACSTPQAGAQDGLKGALARADLTSSKSVRTPFQQTLASADFDGDNKPDGAVLVDTGWLPPRGGRRTIELHFTGRAITNLTFETTEVALAISAVDVNRDGAPDIVVEEPLTHKRLQVWLNDGHGDFRQARADDYPVSGTATGQQLGCPRPIGTPALCWRSQRGFEFGDLTRAKSGCRADLADAQAFPPDLLRVFSSATTPGSPRAPPSSL